MYTDSLLGNEVHEEDVNDVEGCFEMQCNQVFIGMVTMQYQAQIDMVGIVCHALASHYHHLNAKAIITSYNSCSIDGAFAT